MPFECLNLKISTFDFGFDFPLSAGTATEDILSTLFRDEGAEDYIVCHECCHIRPP